MYHRIKAPHMFKRISAEDKESSDIICAVNRWGTIMELKNLPESVVSALKKAWPFFKPCTVSKKQQAALTRLWCSLFIGGLVRLFS